MCGREVCRDTVRTGIRPVTGDGVISVSGDLPTISVQPGIVESAPKAANEVYEGEDAVITIAATGATSYQWQTSPDDATWTNVGTSSTTYTISNTVRATHDGLYIRCRVTNAIGTTDSSSLQLSVWSPLELTGMQLWIDASDAATVFEDTADAAEADDPVQIVNDKSGNSRHMSQSTWVSRAVWRAAAQNGRSALEFDGVNDFYEAGAIGNWNFLHDGTDSLVVIVAQIGNVANPAAILGLIGTTTGTIVGYGLYYDDSGAKNNRLVSFARGASANVVLNESADDAISPTSWAIVEDRIDADNATASQRSRAIVNGGAEIANNALTATASTSDSGSNLTIGRLVISLHFSGCIGELILCNSSNTALRAKLRGFLSYKWGIALV